MFNFTILNLTLSLLTGFHDPKAHDLIRAQKCMIQNKYYLNEYLYAANPISPTQLFNMDTYLRPLKSVDNLEKMKWSILPIQDMPTVYIKSALKNEYLCAYESFGDIFGYRRELYRVKFAPDLPFLYKNCEWYLRKSSKGISYTIWNFVYGEMLYGASFFFKKSMKDRRVFMWHKPVVKSDKYKWTIACQ
jgi:hypothetical protein